MLTVDELPPLFFRVVGTLFGLLWGSFLNVVIHRVPAGLSVVHPPSHCPACQTPIRIRDNLPVVGWLLLRGKARCCGAPISARYPMVEAAGGLLALAIVEAVILQLPAGTSLLHGVMVFAADLALVLGLVAAAFIDVEHLYIPDGISLGGAALGFATASFRGLPYRESLIGAVGGFLLVWLPFDFLYRRLRGRTGMAQGDARLVLLAGAWFGLRGAVFALLAGSVQGSLAAVGMMMIKGRLDDPEAVERERAAIRAEIAALPEEERAAAEEEVKDDPIFEENSSGLLGVRMPFGPFLALATIEYLLLGRLIEPYLSLVW